MVGHIHLLSTMIQVLVNGQALVMVRPEMLRDSSPYLFFYHLAKALYDQRQATADIAFVMYLDRIGYESLKALHFVEKLPTCSIGTEMTLRTDYGEEVVRFDVMFESGADVLDRSESQMRFGAQIDRMLR
jgi:hypothetical protein